MSKRSILLAALAAAALAAPVLAQQPAPTAGTGAAGSGPAGDWTLQPALVKHVAPRGPELAAAGIKGIAARTGRQRRDIQVVTQFGPAYFAMAEGRGARDLRDRGRGGQQRRGVDDRLRIRRRSEVSRRDRRGDSGGRARSGTREGAGDAAEGGPLSGRLGRARARPSG